MGASAREHKSYDEVAEAMGLTVREVKLIEKRALQKLRNYHLSNAMGATLRNGTATKARIWVSILRRYWDDG